MRIIVSWGLCWGSLFYFGKAATYTPWQLVCKLMTEYTGFEFAEPANGPRHNTSMTYDGPTRTRVIRVNGPPLHALRITPISSDQGKPSLQRSSKKTDIPNKAPSHNFKTTFPRKDPNAKSSSSSLWLL